MITFSRTVPVLIAALGLAACNNADTAASDSSNAAANMTAAVEGAMPAGTGDTPTTPDFVAKAAISDMFEIESAKVVLARSQNAEVRKFAEQMLADHGASSAKLKAIVAKDQLAPPPAALDEAHATLLGGLKATGAAELDTVYLDQQTKAHAAALALLQGYAAGGDNADLKALATKLAPKVKGHADMVVGLDKTAADDQAAAKPAS